MDKYSAICEDGQGGKLRIKKFWGKGPFRLELKDNTNNTTATYTIPRTAVPMAPSSPPADARELRHRMREDRHGHVA